MRYTLSTAEEELMNLFWQEGDPQNFAEIMKYCHDILGKQWKKQTVNTFLTRLIEKGFLRRKNGNYYLAIGSRKEYEQLQALELIETMYQGSLKNFLTALSGHTGLTNEEAIELKDFLNSLDE